MVEITCQRDNSEALFYTIHVIFATKIFRVTFSTIFKQLEQLVLL